MVRFKQMSFDNAPRRASFPFNHAALLEDVDGTLTGHSGASILPHMKIMNPAHCTQDASVSYGVPGAICTQGKFRKVVWNRVRPSSVNEKPALLTNEFGSDTVLWRKKSKTLALGYTAFLIAGETLELSFMNGTQFTNISFNMQIYELLDDEWGLLKMKFAQTPDHFSAVLNSTKNSTATIPDASMDNGDYYYDDETKEMIMLYSGKGNTPEKPLLKPITLSVHRCFYDNCIAPTPLEGRPDDTRKWSRLADWIGKKL